VPLNSKKAITEAVKGWLRRYQQITEDIENLESRLEVLEIRAKSPRTSNIDGMPHEPSSEHDRIGDAVAKIDSVKRTIAERKAQANEVYREIDTMIERLQGRYAHLWRIILQLRYLDHAEWNDINFSVFGGKNDYNDKEESYMRRVYKYHKDALVALLNLIPIETLQKFAVNTEDRK